MGLTGAVGRSLDDCVVSTSRVGGGDVAESFRIVTATGRVLFAKTHADPPAGFFTTEAAGLEWLREADATRIPDVIAVSDGGGADDPAFLVLEWIESGHATDDTEVELGRSLADLHRSGAPCFGRLDRRTTGSRALPNEPTDEWVDFFAHQRLEPLVRLAHDARALSTDTEHMVDAVVRQLDRLAGPREPPARIHGDLWAGNRMIDASGRSWLIDPAAHGGHREFDLAMMRLFGGYGHECFDAYHERFPLADGWEQRVPLHQLAPLIVHAIKFGGGYAAATERAARAALSA